MGIHLGVTTMDEVVAILERHEWVEKVILPDPVGRQRILWTWSRLQPDWIDGKIVGELDLDDTISGLVRVRSKIQYGDIWLTFGEPDFGNAFGTAAPDGLLNLWAPFGAGHVAQYEQDRFVTWTIGICRYFWQEPSDIIIGLQSTSLFSEYVSAGIQRRVLCIVENRS